MAVAANCWFVPGRITAFGGVTVIATSWSCTARVVEPTTVPEAAEILVVPEATPVARPCDPGALPIVATIADEDAHVAIDVMFAVVPSV